MPDWLHEYHGHRIAREDGRDNLYRHWKCKKTGRWRRKSLGTNDLITAIETLKQLVDIEETPVKPPEAVPLANVVAHYLTHKLKPKREDPLVPSELERTNARIAREVLDLLKIIYGIDTHPTVAQFDLLAQRRLVKMWSERGMRNETAANYMRRLASMVNYALKPQIVTADDGEETIVHVLERAPFIETRREVIRSWCGVHRPAKEIYIPSLEEVAKLLDEIKSNEEWAVRYAIMALATGARPGHILDIDCSKAVNWKTDMIDINPPGRLQNTKRRPKIALSAILAGWIKVWGTPFPIHAERPNINRENFSACLRRTSKRAELPLFKTYTFRHFLNQMMMERDIPRTVRSAWMGHSDPTGSTTTTVYEHETAQLFSKAVLCVDQVMLEINVHMQNRSLFPPGFNPDASHLRLVKGDGS